MGNIISAIRLFYSSIPTPELFGAYHISSIILTFVVAYIVCRFYKKGDTDRVLIFVFATSMIVVAFEVYKQISYSFSISEGRIVFDYNWSKFPFQFCSLPMFVGFLTKVVKKGGKLQESFLAFLATYAIFGGASVLFYPATVFSESFGMNIQTMVCHGSMIVVGILLYYSGVVKAEWKTLLKALPVFFVTFAMAIAMNHIANAVGINEVGKFDMFYFSPYFDSSLPVYSALQPILPYPVCLLIYFVGFTFIASLILLVAIGFSQLSKRRNKQLGIK